MRDGRLPSELRAVAIGLLTDEHVEQLTPWTVAVLESNRDPDLARAILQRLSETSALPRQALDVLLRIARDPTEASATRCDALLVLQWARPRPFAEWVVLMSDRHDDVAVEATRTALVWHARNPDWLQEDQLNERSFANDVRELLEFAVPSLAKNKSRRPENESEWQSALSGGGDASRGRRVFHSARVACARCHSTSGRSGLLGPDLSGASRSKSREQIIASILDPSAEFPPQYQAWSVTSTDGRTFRGLQLDHKRNGAIELIDDSGNKLRFEGEDVDDYEATPGSLMPDGLESTMSVNEFRDLVAYLMSLGQ